jgi:hypothetical protein
MRGLPSCVALFVFAPGLGYLVALLLLAIRTGLL